MYVCMYVVRFVRKKLARWRSSVKERELLLRRAAEVLKKIQRKPYDQKLRREVRLTNSLSHLRLFMSVLYRKTENRNNINNI